MVSTKDAQHSFNQLPTVPLLEHACIPCPLTVSVWNAMASDCICCCCCALCAMSSGLVSAAAMARLYAAATASELRPSSALRPRRDRAAASRLEPAEAAEEEAADEGPDQLIVTRCGTSQW